jgi:hypothetical protein
MLIKVFSILISILFQLASRFLTLSLSFYLFLETLHWKLFGRKRSVVFLSIYPVAIKNKSMTFEQVHNNQQ